MDEGLINDLWGWFQHPIYSHGNVEDWAAGFVVLLIVAFLWSMVVRRIVE